MTDEKFTGSQGEQGEQGEKGDTGVQGETGKQGPPGDVLSLEELAVAVNKLRVAVKPMFGRVDAIWKLLRRRIWVGAVVLVVLLILIGWVSYVAVTANTAASRSESNQDSVYAQCLATNVSRADTRKFWIKVVLPLFARPDADTQAAVAYVKGQVNIIYAPKNCSVLPHSVGAK